MVFRETRVTVTSEVPEGCKEFASQLLDRFLTYLYDHTNESPSMPRGQLLQGFVRHLKGESTEPYPENVVPFERKEKVPQ